MNEVKTQSNGRVIHHIQYKPAWDLKRLCVLTPLGSPTGPQKRVFGQCPTFGYALVGGWSTGGYCMPGGCTGWVYRVGNTRVPYPAARGGPQPVTAKRAPEAPSRGAGVGGHRRAGDRARDGSQTHPPGPVGPCRPSLVWDPQNAPSWPIRRDLQSFY